MEENLINPQPVQPALSTQPDQTIQQAPSIQPSQSVQPIGAMAEKAEIPPIITGKRKDFLIGLLFGVAGAVVLALLDLLFIAMANPAQEILISLLIFLGPLLILGIYIFLAIYFFKRRKNIFWGLLVGFFLFIALAVLTAIII